MLRRAFVAPLRSMEFIGTIAAANQLHRSFAAKYAAQDDKVAGFAIQPSENLRLFLEASQSPDWR
jgi:hypothetical protein